MIFNAPEWLKKADLVDTTSIVHSVIEGIMAAELAVIEQKIEEAIQGGEHGVKVRRDRLTAKLLSIEVDSSVPYGCIHEHYVEVGLDV